MIIKIAKDYWDEGFDLFPKDELDLQPGITVLVGCNGSGKSTLLSQIRHHCMESGIPYKGYDNLSDGGSNSKQAAGYLGNMDLLANLVCSSEGEEMMMNISNFAGSVGNFIHNKLDAKVIHKEFFIIFDATDSGLSIDNIIEFKKFCKLVIDDCSTKDVYIIVTANGFEMARGSRCLDVTTFEYVDFKDYEEYRNFVIETRNKKDERNKIEKFDYEEEEGVNWDDYRKPKEE